MVMIPVNRIPVEELYKTFQDKGDLRLFGYFEALIFLSSRLCYARNH